MTWALPLVGLLSFGAGIISLASAVLVPAAMAALVVVVESAAGLAVVVAPAVALRTALAAPVLEVLAVV